MNKKITTPFLFLTITFMSAFQPITAQLNPATEKKVSNLVKQMTLEEKVGQMAQVSVESLGKVEGGKFTFDTEKLRDAVMNYKIGSLLNSPGEPLRP